MSDIISATDQFWSNYDPWMNQAKAEAYKVKDCNPNYESCDVPYAFMMSDEEKVLSFQASIFYGAFNLVMWLVPVIFETTLIDRITDGDADEGSVEFLEIASDLLWIGNLIVYGIGMIMTPFSYFEDVFGRVMIDIYLSYTQWGIILIGGGLQVINFGMTLAAAISNSVSSPSVWAWWVVNFVFTAGSYVGYILLNNSFIQYYTHEMLLGLLNDFQEAGELTEENADTIAADISAIETVVEENSLDGLVADDTPAPEEAPAAEEPAAEEPATEEPAAEEPTEAAE